MTGKDRVVIQNIHACTERVQIDWPWNINNTIVDTVNGTTCLSSILEVTVTNAIQLLADLFLALDVEQTQSMGELLLLPAWLYLPW